MDPVCLAVMERERKKGREERERIFLRTARERIELFLIFNIVVYIILISCM